MEVANIYTSIGCNQTTECADWGNNGLIVFGANNAIAILDPKFDGNSSKIIHTYHHHSRRVNTVQWLRRTPDEHEKLFISGSDDKLAILWDISKSDAPIKYQLEGHESGVTAVNGIFTSADNTWLIATASADSSIKIWLFNGNSCQCIQTISLNRGFCFSLRLVRLPLTDRVLLAYSSDDETIQLWSQEPNSNQFQFVHKLIGHTEWVRGLDFAADNDNDLLLASSSQDNYIRLWRISVCSKDELIKKEDDFLSMYDDNGELRVEEIQFPIDATNRFTVNLEAVLYGHEGWVYGVHWHASEKNGLKLLSSSIDKTMIIWKRTEDDVWLEDVRVGDVGGNTMGFYGGKFSNDGESIMGHSYQGAFHIWTRTQENDQIWRPIVTISGHFGEVRDIAWEPHGAYLMSVSADQTTRLHGPWRRSKDDIVTWHELGRPQVHGYDLQAIAIISRYKFASGADEKIVRTFQAPANFIKNFRTITGIRDDKEGDELLKNLPEGASVPSLGLSNKAVYNTESDEIEQKHVKDMYPENYFVPMVIDNPPQEEALMQNTLWPEVHKLYGHGYEIYALAASADGKVLASTCRSTNFEHSNIILWNTKTWKQYQKLGVHQLTVTQLRFSPDDRFLLSVSRDRRWTLFETKQVGNFERTFEVVAATDKSNGVHTRVIWCCDWSSDSKYFITGSREGKVAIWTHDIESVQSPLNGWRSLEVLEIKKESITALAFSPTMQAENEYIVAIGSESGLIQIYRFDGKWTLLLQLNSNLGHHSTVRRLQFRPTTTSGPDSATVHHLASCGDDHLVRIYELKLKSIDIS